MKKTALSLTLLMALACPTLAGEVSIPPAPDQPLCDPAVQSCASSQPADTSEDATEGAASLLFNLLLSLLD